MTSCTYSTSFSITQYSCGSLFLYQHKFLHRISFYDFQIVKSPFQIQFDLGKWIKRSYTVHGGEDMEVAALVQFRLWQRNVEQTQTSLLVCCGGFASPLMTTFLVTCSILHHGDATDIINNNPYLLLNPREWTYDARHHFDWRKLQQYFCLALTLLSCLLPLGQRSFPNRWLGLCFWIVAIGSCFLASDNVP